MIEIRLYRSMIVSQTVIVAALISYRIAVDDIAGSSIRTDLKVILAVYRGRLRPKFK